MKKLLLSVFLALMLVGVAEAAITPQYVNKMITSPSDDALLNYNLEQFSWELLGTSYPLDSCYYVLNSEDKNYFDCSLYTVPFSSPLTDGSYDLLLFVNNTNGDYNSEVISFSVDTTPPSVSIVSPTEGSIIGGTVSLMAEADDSLSGVERVEFWNNNGEIGEDTDEPYSIDWDTTLVLDGSYFIYAVAYDNAGNFGYAEQVNVIVDNTAPSSYNDYDGEWHNADFDVTITASDQWSGVAYIKYRIDGGEWAQIEGDTVVINVNQEGIYNIEYYAVDNLGNEEGVNVVTIYLDKSAPDVILNDPENNVPFAYNAEGIIFAFNTIDELSGVQECYLVLDGEIADTNSECGGGPEAAPAALPWCYFEEELPALGKHSWSVNCTDVADNEGISDTRNFTVLSELTFDEGTEVPDLTLEDDITSVWFYVKNEWGMINWTVPLDLSRGLDWALYINLSSNWAEVDSLNAGELNENARIEIYNLSWSNPRILKNGEVCGEEQGCHFVSYENGTLIFDVTGFSYYTTEETPSASPSGGGSSRGSCRSLWNCSEWGLCIGGEQTRTCTKMNSYCYYSYEKPEEKRSCSVPVSSNVTIANEEASDEDKNDVTNNKEEGLLSRITGAIIGAIGNGRPLVIIIFFAGLIAAYVYVARMRRKIMQEKLEGELRRVRLKPEE